jgi:hypothetical protein
MPDSRRKTLMDAIVERLRTIQIAAGYATDAGSNVHVWRDSRAAPFEAAELPALNVRDLRRKGEQQLYDRQDHVLSVSVEVVTGAGIVADQVRKILADLEQCIGVDRKWTVASVAIALDTRPSEDEIAVQQDGGAIAGARFDFDVIYRTKNFDPYNP